jgi:transcription antitermination factor NusG
MTSTDWLLLYTKSGKETFAADNLYNQRIEYYLPMQPVWTKKRNRATEVEIPLFPRYLFARPTPGMLRSISGTRGVRGIVRFGDEPITVENDIIEGIKSEIILASETRAAKGIDRRYGFAINEVVKIIDCFSAYFERTGKFKGPGKNSGEILIEIDYPNLGKSFTHPFPVGSAMSA